MNVYILLKKKKKIILERFYTRSLEIVEIHITTIIRLLIENKGFFRCSTNE